MGFRNFGFAFCYSIIRKFLVVSLVSIPISKFFAQVDDQKYLDSVQQAINKEKDAYKKARKIMQLSNFWAYRDTVKAFKQLDLADPYIKSNKALQGLKLIYKAGIIYDNDIPRSLEIYKEADEILKNAKGKHVAEDRAILWHNYAALEQLRGNDYLFLKIIIEKSLPLAKEAKNETILASYYADVGSTMNNTKEYKKSEQYFLEALKILDNQKTDEYSAKVWTLLNIANMYINSKQLEKAELRLNEAKKYLQSTPNSEYTSYYYLQLANLQNIKGNQNLAIESIDKGIDVCKKLKVTYDLESLQFEKYKLLKIQKRYIEAELILEELLNANYLENPKNRLKYLDEMAWLQNEMQNYKEAYHFQNLYQKLNDSINTQKKQKDIRELETKYDTATKENKILNLESKSRLQNTIIWASILSLLGISGFSFYAINQRKKRNAQKIQIIQQSKELEVANATIDGGLVERKRIARDMHDGLSGRITGVKMNLESSEAFKENPNVQKSVSELDKVIVELRQIVRNLMPETLLAQGLEKSLQNFCTSMNSEKTTVSFYGSNLNEITDRFQQLNIYRIVQELVTNAIRHGEPTEILAQITYDKPVLLIDVEDNGKGFDLETVQRNLGLNSVENRVKSLNGNVKWTSTPGNGTFVNIECHL